MTLFRKVCCVAVVVGVGIWFVGCTNMQSNQGGDSTPQGLMGTNTNNPTEGALGHGGNRLNMGNTTGNSSGVGTGGGM